MNDVTIDNYQGLAERTSATANAGGCASAQVRIDTNTIRLLHGGMGLSTEAGEFLDELKKHIFYGKPLDLVNLAEECGDAFWYLAEILTALDRRFIDVMQQNIDKLRTRYPERFTHEAALVRDLDAEREVLEEADKAYDYLAADMHKELETHNVLSVPKGIVVGAPPWAYWAPEDPRWAQVDKAERDKWLLTEEFKQAADIEASTPITAGHRTCPHCGVALETMAICPDCATKGHRFAAGGTGGPVDPDTVQQRIAGDLPPHPPGVGKVRFFIDDVESGEPRAYVGDADDIPAAIKSLGYFAEYAFEELAKDPDGEPHTFEVSARIMTDAEVEALPQL